MTQTTFDDEELFDEAAAETRETVQSLLDEARAALPAAEEIWSVDAENTLGVLNTLQQTLDTGDAEAQLKKAKKEFIVAERADMFDDADDLRTAIEEVETLLGDIDAAASDVGELTKTIPPLRAALEDAEAATDAETDAEADAEAEA